MKITAAFTILLGVSLMPLPMFASESLIERHLASAAGGFTYTVAGEEGATSGEGARLRAGESYTIDRKVKGPCAVYVSLVTPSPALIASWGASSEVIRGNRRYYYGVKEAFPPIATIDVEGNLYGRNLASPGESVAQEVFAGIGDFGNGPLVISSREGECRITRVRIRQLTGEEQKLAAHKNDPLHHKTVIYNNDGYSNGFATVEWNYKDFLRQVDVYEGSDVKQLDWSPLVTGVVSYPSKYSDMFGDGVTQWAREIERLASERYRNLEKDGTPLYPSLVKRGKEIGVEVWGSLRMSAYYGDHPYGHVYNGSLWRQKNAEFMILNKDGNSLNSAKRLSYAFEPVRNQRLGVLQELAEMGCAGVNLDFCRYPWIYGYEKPLIEEFQEKYGVDPRTLEEFDGRWTRFRCDKFNDFMRELRGRLNVVAEKRGAPVGISVRLPATDYREYGFDPETWIKERLVNQLVIGFPSVNKPYDSKPWVKMVKGSSVELYGNIEFFIQTGKRFELTDEQVRQGMKVDPITSYTREDYLRRAAVLYKEGVHGLYIFNNFASKIAESLSQLGDREWVQRWSEFEDRAKLHSELVVIKEQK